MSVGEKDLIGELNGFPIDIVRAMLSEQKKQCGKTNVSIFQKDRSASCSEGGFLWRHTRDGQEFWERIISRRDFDVFYRTYENFDAFLAGQIADAIVVKMEPTKLELWLLENIKREKGDHLTLYECLCKFRDKMRTSDCMRWREFAMRFDCEDFLFTITPQSKKWFEDEFLGGDSIDDGRLSHLISECVDLCIDARTLCETDTYCDTLNIKCLGSRKSCSNFALGYIERHPELFKKFRTVRFGFANGWVSTTKVNINEDAFLLDCEKFRGFERSRDIFKIGNRYIDFTNYEF